MEPKTKIFSPRVVIQALFFAVVGPFLPLLISWRWDWWEAWVYAVVAILGFAASRALAARRNADLLVERSRFLQHADAKRWDKVLAPLVGLGVSLLSLAAGLEALIDREFTFSLGVKIAAILIILAGYGLGSYALIENRFFSGMVRIQKERGHTVISSGPYRWVRHPGYAGGLLTYLATPLWLDSRWAFLPVIFLTVVLILRTRLEDQTLQEELEGYKAYAARVRYRLLPGVW